MTDDMQFGDVQEAKPEVSLRPDRNAHYVVANYEHPKEGEVPVFLDFDVMLDMEAHAASDKSVELGGVLLGGQYHDDEGRPFVVITDSLRAKHYESTKGSFKFTKEAWTEITKERNEYSADLQMVGWYHTHPDWGVFLSGMDMFICDNFFNRPLDMAYVIDPCRGDRAFFQWTDDPRDRCKRQRGFFVMTSRYRAAELAAAVTCLQGGNAMPADNRLPGYPSMGAPVINVSSPPQSPQQNLAVLGMLTIQVCLLALLVFKLFAPATETDAHAELAKIAKQLEQIAEREDGVRTQQAVVKALDSALAESGEMAPGMFEKLAELQKQNDQLASAGQGHALRAEQLAEEKLGIAMDAKIAKEDLERTVADLRNEKKRLLTDNEKLEGEVAKYKPKKAKTDDAEAETDWTWYWVGGLVLGVVAVGGLLATLAYKPTRPEDLANERERVTPGTSADKVPTPVEERVFEERP